MTIILVALCCVIMGFCLGMLYKAAKGKDTVIMEEKIIKDILRKHCMCKEE